MTLSKKRYDAIMRAIRETITDTRILAAKLPGASPAIDARIAQAEIQLYRRIGDILKGGAT